eukprot:2232171-Prymnesium_polylepis.1
MAWLRGRQAATAGGAGVKWRRPGERVSSEARCAPGGDGRGSGCQVRHGAPPTEAHTPALRCGIGLRTDALGCEMRAGGGPGCAWDERHFWSRA